jgi:hypothetical protein
MARQSRYKVFVSYARHDEALVRPLAGLLGASPTVVFLDVQAIKAGDLWEDEIRRAIIDAPVFILCWCCESLRSSMVAQEIELALRAGRKRLVPVLLCGTPLPSQLRDRQWIDLSGKILHKCLDGYIHEPQMARSEGRAVRPLPMPHSARQSFETIILVSSVFPVCGVVLLWLLFAGTPITSEMIWAAAGIVLAWLCGFVPLVWFLYSQDIRSEAIADRAIRYFEGLAPKE